jgi:hypothetical protein
MERPFMSPGWKRWSSFLLLGLVASFCCDKQWLCPSSAASPLMQSRRIAKLSFPETRLRLLVRFGNIFYCPPPVEEPEDAPVPDVQNDVEAFHIILNHLGLKDAAKLSHDQSLLTYREYQKMRAIRLEADGHNYTFSLNVRDKDGDFRIDGTVDSQGGIKVLQQERAVFNCPKCLAGDTRIATPSGAIAIRDLKYGMLVWTIDSNNHKIAVPILRTSAVPVSAGHHMIHLVLRDGRQIWASPGHPTSDGRTVSRLKKNTTYDGGAVEINESVPYGASATYDLLPAGETGFYWANGIQLASTLR